MHRRMRTNFPLVICETCMLPKAFQEKKIKNSFKFAAWRFLIISRDSRGNYSKFKVTSNDLEQRINKGFFSSSGNPILAISNKI